MRIALVRLSSMGDILHSLSPLPELKALIPELWVEWFVDSRFAPLLEHCPWIDLLHPLPLKDGAFKEAWLKVKKSPRYDVVIDGQGLIKSALVARLLHAKLRFGFDRHSIKEPLASLLYTHTVSIPYEAHILERNAVLMEGAFGVKLDREALFAPPALLGYRSQSPCEITHPRAVLLVPGASTPEKIWPQEHMGALIDGLDATFYLLHHTQEEERFARSLHAAHPNRTHLLPKLSLDALKALLPEMNLIIGGDTGPTHMAWAMRRPSLTLFGATRMERFCLHTPINRCLTSQDGTMRGLASESVIVAAQELLA